MFVFEVFTTQKMAFEEAQKKGEKFYFAVDKGEGGKKEYGSCTDPDTFMLGYENQKIKNFYELLHENSPVCEYYDIDMSAEDNINNLTSEEYFEMFQGIHSQFANEELGLTFQKANWKITDSSRDGKISLHLINRSRVWKNNQETNYWYSLFERFLKIQYPSLVLFDTAVKSKNRCMRLIGSSKFGQNRPLQRASWHQSSVDEDDTTAFCIQQVNEDLIDGCSLQLAQIKVRMDKKIEDEKLTQKEVKVFTKKFVEIKCADEEQDVPELLISLISEMIKAGSHSLCDSATRTMLTYADIRNLAFAFCNSATYREDENALTNFISKQIYPLYRHSNQYAPETIIGQIVRASITPNEKDKIYTIASLHFWAKENPKYVELFKSKSAEEKIDISDEACAKYIFENTDFLYHGTRKQLYIYDDKVKLWVLTHKECLRNCILPVLSNYIKDDPDSVEELKTTRKQTTILTRLWAMILASPKDALIDSTLDKKIGLFPISNGKVINLHTLEVRERIKLDYFTRATKREFLAEPNEDFVRNYLGEVLTTQNKSYVDFLLYVLGYCLSGENNMKHFYILFGPKDTGKSLFLKILGLIFESWAGPVNNKVFKQSKSESVHDTEAFDLFQKRIAFVSELEETEKFNEQLIKRISGGDPTSIRGCGVDQNVLATFNCVLMLATNEIPTFKEPAFAQRMRVIGFKTKFQNNIARRDAILARIDDFFTMACIFAKKYYDNGGAFEDVKEVIDSTQAIMDERDTFKSWWEEDNFEINNDFRGLCPAVCDSEWRAKKTDVFSNYTGWCTQNNIESLGRTKFYSRFQQEFNLPTIINDKYWRGIREKSF
jgi:P4 family phage/plasmid primase-like protien